MPPKKGKKFLNQEADLLDGDIANLAHLPNPRPFLQGVAEEDLFGAEQSMFAELNHDHDEKVVRAAAFGHNETGQPVAEHTLTGDDNVTPAFSIPSEAELDALDTHMRAQTAKAPAEYELAPANAIEAPIQVKRIAYNVMVTDPRNGMIIERDYKEPLPPRVPTMFVDRLDGVTSITDIEREEDSSLRLTQVNPRIVDPCSTVRLVQSAVQAQDSAPRYLSRFNNQEPRSSLTDYLDSEDDLLRFNIQFYSSLTDTLDSVTLDSAAHDPAAHDPAFRFKRNRPVVPTPELNTDRAEEMAVEYAGKALTTRLKAIKAQKLPERKEKAALNAHKAVIRAARAPIGAPEDFARGTPKYIARKQLEAERADKAALDALDDPSYDPDNMLAELEAREDSSAEPGTGAAATIRRSGRGHAGSKVTKPMKPGKRPLNEVETEADSEPQPKKKLRLTLTKGSKASSSTDGSKAGTSASATATSSSAGPSTGDTTAISSPAGPPTIGSSKSVAGPPGTGADRPLESPPSNDETAESPTGKKPSSSKASSKGGRKTRRTSKWTSGASTASGSTAPATSGPTSTAPTTTSTAPTSTTGTSTSGRKPTKEDEFKAEAEKGRQAAKDGADPGRPKRKR